MIIVVFDISVAFFHGKVRKVMFVVPPMEFRKKGKIWRLLKSVHRTRDASQVFATYVEQGFNDHGFHRNIIFGILDDRADDFDQLMREVFKVKIFERVGRGFLTSLEFLQEGGWDAEGFSWTHDPKHTLAIADGFGFNGK